LYLHQVVILLVSTPHGCYPKSFSFISFGFNFLVPSAFMAMLPLFL